MGNKNDSRITKEDERLLVHPLWMAGWNTFCKGIWMQEVEFAQTLGD